MSQKLFLTVIKVITPLFHHFAIIHFSGEFSLEFSVFFYILIDLVSHQTGRVPFNQNTSHFIQQPGFSALGHQSGPIHNLELISQDLPARAYHPRSSQDLACSHQPGLISQDPPPRIDQPWVISLDLFP